MKEIFLNFLKNHGERLIFMCLAGMIASIMFVLGWIDESKVIIIGLGMMCFNKSREPKINKEKE